MTKGISNFFPAIGSKFNSCHDAHGQFCSGGGGGRTGGGFQTAGGVVKVGNTIIWQTPQMRNRGGGIRGGKVLSSPNKDGFFGVTNGIGGPKTEIHTGDVVSITG